MMWRALIAVWFLAGVTLAPAQQIGPSVLSTSLVDTVFCNTVGYILARTTGVWACSKSSAVNPDWFGADRTGTTDSTAAFTSMFAAIGTGRHVDIGDGVYQVCNLAPPRNTWISGSLGWGELLNDFVNAPLGQRVNPYANGALTAPFTSVIGGGQLQLKAGCANAPGYSRPAVIVASNGLYVSNLSAIPIGLSLPATTNAEAATLLGQYRGIFIYGDRASVKVKNTGVWGFHDNVYLTNSGGVNGTMRCIYEENLSDTIDGYKCVASGEWGYIAHNHAGTFLTLGITGLAAPNTERSGTAFRIENCTAIRVHNNMEFGYNIGYAAIDAANIHFISNHAESYGTAADQYGILVSKSSTYSQYPDIEQNWIIGYGRGIFVNLTGTPAGNNTTHVVNNSVVGIPGGIGIDIGTNAYALVTGNTIQNGAVGIALEVGIVGGNVQTNQMIGQTVVSISNAYTGTALRIQDNLGYNPIGPSAITVGASPFTYTAGASPETIYNWGGTTTAITVNGTGINPTSPVIELGPNEVVVVTYTALPSLVRMRH